MQNDIDEKIWEALSRIASHEAMCEERSKTIFNRLESIEMQLAQVHRNMFVIGMGLISGMGGIIVTLALS
jgi:hypothetical protein